MTWGFLYEYGVAYRLFIVSSDYPYSCRMRVVMKHKVLIIDNEAVMRGLLRSYFEADLFDVIEAEDGEKGFDVFAREKPDLVLLDINVPGKNGITMLQEVHRSLPENTVPIIVFSNVNDTIRVADLMESGSYYYLVKNDWNVRDVVRFAKNKLMRISDSLPCE